MLSVWSSKVSLAIAPLQDLLNLDSGHRMNVPGCAENNWQWRCTAEMLASSRFASLKKTTNAANRSPVQKGVATQEAIA